MIFFSVIKAISTPTAWYKKIEVLPWPGGSVGWSIVPCAQREWNGMETVGTLYIEVQTWDKARHVQVTKVQYNRGKKFEGGEWKGMRFKNVKTGQENENCIVTLGIWKVADCATPHGCRTSGCATSKSAALGYWLYGAVGTGKAVNTGNGFLWTPSAA